MVSAAPICSPTATPISSLKYGKCQLPGSSTTPSTAMNRPAVIFFMLVVPFEVRVSFRVAAPTSQTMPVAETHRDWANLFPDR
jgi:hypothetical protein